MPKAPLGATIAAGTRSCGDLPQSTTSIMMATAMCTRLRIW